MTQVDATYQGGIFKPLPTVELPENRRVWLRIQPDRALDIAKDRRR